MGGGSSSSPSITSTSTNRAIKGKGFEHNTESISTTSHTTASELMDMMSEIDPLDLGFTKGQGGRIIARLTSIIFHSLSI